MRQRETILGRFFVGDVGIDEASDSEALQGTKEGQENISDLRVFVGLLDEPACVLWGKRRG